METRQLLLPLSIVVAGALIGAGLFFGRTAAPPRGTDRPTDSTVVLPAPLLTAPPPDAGEATRTLPPGVTAALQARVDERAAEAVARARPGILQQCWEPSRRKHPTPASMVVRVRFLFEASGKQVDFSVADADEPHRRDVTDCIRRSNLVVTIDPPGTMVATQLSIELS